MARCVECVHFDVCYLSEIDNDIRDSGENPNCLHFISTADVAPKSEVAREIFEKIEDECFDQFGYLDYDKFFELKAKYIFKKRCPDCKHFVGCEAACGGVPCDMYEGDTNAE